MENFILLFLWLSSLASIPRVLLAADTINSTHFIKDGETIVSSGGTFELGFFSPGDSKNRYVGMWFNDITSNITVFWVANREIPLTNTSGVLKIINPGILVIMTTDANNIIWSSNLTSRSAQNPIAKLLDSGNLVVRDASDDDKEESFLWQSFDYPGNMLLPGMKFGIDFESGLDRSLSSWKSKDDPAVGEYKYQCDPTGYPQDFLRSGSDDLFRSGPWNGVRFSGIPNTVPNSIFTPGFVFNKKEVYYIFQLLNESVITGSLLDEMGTIQRWTLRVGETLGWVANLALPADNCDTFNICGAHGICNVARSPQCSCLDKFIPRQPDNWASTDWSKGCVRKTPLNCHNNGTDGFRKYYNVKLPDTRHSRFNFTMTLKECEMECFKNCSCTAYANIDIRNGGSGCLLWAGDLVDIKEISEGAGQDLYVRMASSDSDSANAGSNTRKAKIMKVSLPLVVGLVVLGISLTMYVRKKRKKKLHLMREVRLGQHEHEYSNNRKEDPELPFFYLSTIANATNKFSDSNKIGEGGFGEVYKGVLKEGQEIAVKRLSRNSQQGLDEFKTEVICIAKLQHRNLVKLLGCCIEGEEKMLIYEYMANKSLDSFIFDGTRSKIFDWPTRFHIINGIARGVLYLHQDSRLRIIHRDLKVSNILLDFEMNPKISDFGTARCFGGNETEANTKRVVGTYGYMSPEYAVDGIFSVKSDVFSFGVMVLEIVSGKRNRGFFHPDHEHNLLGHAWKLLIAGSSLELIDDCVCDSCYISQVLRCIHIGLLCVQQCPKDRPSMSDVVVMLASEAELPTPKQPGFFTERSILKNLEYTSSSQAASSVNEVTMTALHGR